MDRLRVPLSFEQRQGVTVLVWARWAVLGWLAAILVFPLRPNYFMIVVVSASMASAAIMNAALHRRLARPGLHANGKVAHHAGHDSHGDAEHRPFRTGLGFALERQRHR